VVLVAAAVVHVVGIVPSILSTSVTGARMVLMDVYKAKEALNLEEEERVSVKHGVPTMFILELNHEDFFNYDLRSLRTGIIAAAHAHEEVVWRISTDMGCYLFVCYLLIDSSHKLM